MAKTVEQLTGVRSIWSTLQKELIKAKAPVEILSPDPELAKANLLAIQITLQSDFGAILYFTGGLLIDHGWLRIFGSGGSSLRGLLEWNEGKGIQDGRVVAGSIFIADDVLGGLYALNGGGSLGKDLGKIYYLPPENTKWEPLGLGYSEFIKFAIGGHLSKFYADYRFDGWEELIKELSPNEIWQFGGDPETTIADRQILSINDWFNDILISNK